MARGPPPGAGYTASPMRHRSLRAGAPRLAPISIALLGTLGCASPPERVAATASDTPPASASAPAPRAAPREDDARPEPVPIAGSDFVRGRTTVIVRAPLPKVREAVLDFPHYAEFMPHYRTSRVLGRGADGAREIYMEVEALNGMVRMWAQIEMPKPTTEGGVEAHESRFVKGNVREFKAIWRLKKIDEATTELSLEVFLEPQIPLPTGLVNDENLKGSARGVAAMRAHAEAM
jgi:ribosome-associated toxin RatA of RatAB toxin-antitoxin module